jgi:hypothetical protein
VRRGSAREIFEIVMTYDRSRMFRADSHPRHARITIGVDEVNVSIDKNVVIIRAPRRENQRAQNQDFESGQQNSHKIENRKSEIENRK